MDKVQDRYFTSTVAHALRMRTGDLRMITSGSLKALANLGDGTAVALIKILDFSHLIGESDIRQYLPLVEDSFAKPQFITNDENRIPRVTLFLLSALLAHVHDDELTREIQRVANYVGQQTSLTQE